MAKVVSPPPARDLYVESSFSLGGALRRIRRSEWQPSRWGPML
jgi:hypothetical protein